MNLSLRSRLLTRIALLVGLAAAVSASAAPGAVKHQYVRLDAHLRLAVSGSAPQRIIIRVRAGSRAAVAQAQIDIINLSLGHPIYESAATDPLVQAVERAVRAGMVVVAAAGNYGKNPKTGEPGYAGITSPDAASLPP